MLPSLCSHTFHSTCCLIQPNPKPVVLAKGKEALESGRSVLIFPQSTRLTTFDPSRFAPEQAAHHARYQFMPFGAGPRVCIGGAFAMIEATVILAHLIRAAEFSCPPGFEPEPVARITLAPRDGMPLHVTMRAST